MELFSGSEGASPTQGCTVRKGHGAILVKGGVRRSDNTILCEQRA